MTSKMTLKLTITGCMVHDQRGLVSREIHCVGRMIHPVDLEMRTLMSMMKRSHLLEIIVPSTSTIMVDSMKHFQRKTTMMMTMNQWTRTGGDALPYVSLCGISNPLLVASCLYYCTMYILTVCVEYLYLIITTKFLPVTVVTECVTECAASYFKDC